MPGLIQRPGAVFEPARGLLNNEHFQVCYATNDMARAQDIFHKRFGIREFKGLQGQMPSGGQIHVELAWVGSTMYELVTCSGPGSDMYNHILPGDDFAMAFHHLGFLVANQAGWDDLMQVIADGGWEICQQNNTEGFMRHCYIYVPELAHHCEYIFPEQAGIQFFESVPAT